MLLDGHRAAPSNADGTVDIDTLPQMLVSRIDIVTGGASAVYGSDAVTGVVNFVLDKKFNGLKTDVNAGISTYADAMSYNLGAAAGTDLFGGRGHFEAALEYRHRDPVNQSARPYGPRVQLSRRKWAPARPPIPSTVSPMAGGPIPASAVLSRAACRPVRWRAGTQFAANGVLSALLSRHRRRHRCQRQSDRRHQQSELGRRRRLQPLWPDVQRLSPGHAVRPLQL